MKLEKQFQGTHDPVKNDEVRAARTDSIKQSLKLTAVLLYFIISNIETNFAQTPNWAWAKCFGSATPDRIISSVVDASGNIYSVGYFYDTLDFDPGPNIFNLSPAGMRDGFIVKLDGAGNFLWAKSIGGTQDDYATSVTLDGAGNIYVSGFFNGIVDFNPDTGVFNLNTTVSCPTFVLKLNSSGNFLWAKSFGGAPNNTLCVLTIDPFENIIVSGTFLNTIDFDPGVSVFYLTASIESPFICKLDSSGTFQWAAMLEVQSDYGKISSLAADLAGNIYATGEFETAIDFDPDSGHYILTAASYNDIFVVKLTDSGHFVWAHQEPAGTTDFAQQVIFNPLFPSSIFLNGRYSYSAFGLSGGKSYIVKADTAGIVQWAISNDTWCYSITIDNSGNIYTTGIFTDTVDFDPGAAVFNLYPGPNGGGNLFVLKLDSMKNFQWAISAVGSNIDIGSSIAVDNSGHCFVSGFFWSDTISFGPINCINAGNRDAFIAKLDVVTGLILMINSNIISVYPNPASTSTTISFSLDKPQKVSLKIFDVNGRVVSTLANKTFAAGENKITWNAEEINAGVYFLQMQAEENLLTEKLIVTK